MSIEAARVAFLHAAAGALRLTAFGLRYDADSHQYLTVAGWHSDGQPFASATAPFDDNPIVRAAQLARDIIAAHVGNSDGSRENRPTPPRTITGLSCPLWSQVTAAVGEKEAAFRVEPGPSDANVSREILKEPARMSQKGSGLARLMGGLRDLDQNADALATRLEQAMGNLTQEMATTAQVVGNVESSVTDLKAVNALYSNGQPGNGS